MSRGRVFLLLLLLPVCRTVQGAEVPQTDTLSAASVSSVKTVPVLRAAEEIDLQEAAAPPVLVADVLRRFTGVQVKDYGGVGGLKTIHVRSLGSEHVGIFLDGIQVDNAQNMQVDLGRFSTADIQRVSLYNGQRTRRLQTAKEYAAGASVYLDSGLPAFPDGNGGRFRFRTGAFGTLNPALQWGTKLGRRLTFQGSAEWLRSNGRYPFPCFDTTLVRENGDIRSLRLETRLDGRLNRGHWQLHLYAYGSERGFPGPVIRRAMGFPFSAERQADQDLFAQGTWEQDWTPRYSTALRAKYANQYTHYNTHPERNPMALPYNLHYRQQSGYLSLAHSFQVLENASIEASTDLQRNALNSDAGQFVTPRRTTFTGVVAGRWTGATLRAAAHLVYQGAWDHYLTPQAGGWSRAQRYRDAWMPSVSLSWTPKPWLEASLFAKRSYRLPSFNDLYYSLMGNASLEPESALQLGGDLRFSHAAGPWSVHLRLSPYYNRVSNKIVAIPTVSQFRWTMLNIGRADISGADARADLSFRRGDWTGSLTLRYSFQQALDHSREGSPSWGCQIPYIPRHSGGIEALVGWKGWTIAWSTLLTGSRWSRSAATADYYLPPWSISSLSLDKTFCLPPLRGRSIAPQLQAGVVCDNLFNRPYQLVQGYPMPGRNILVTVTYSW